MTVVSAQGSVAAAVSVVLLNGSLVWLFLQALVRPQNHIHFIYSVAISIFFMQFLNIHAHGLINGINKDAKHRWAALIVIPLYGLFAAIVALAVDTPVPAIMLVANLSIAILFKRTMQDYKVVANMLIMIGTMIGVTLLSPLITRLYQVPQAVRDSKPSVITGALVEQPELLLLWGVIYFTLTTIVDVKHFIKPSTNR
jgi:hypothetical protein